MIDHNLIRRQFPFFFGQYIYLDSAASTQKPKCVIDKINDLYTNHYSNVHRGVCVLSEVLTNEYEASRQVIANYVNAISSNEIIFTKNATEAINLVAQSYGETFLQPNDEIIISSLEHHSNIVPWQMLCKKTDAKLRVIKLDYKHDVDLQHFKELLNHKTKIVAISHVSNVLGNTLPIKEMVKLAKQYDAVVLIDGCQGIVSHQVDVQDLGADFYVFSAHKLYGPTGLGVLWGKKIILDMMPPWLGGGDMIKSVSFEESTWADLPGKFEAGTPPIVEVIALGEAIKYLHQFSVPELLQYKNNLVKNIFAFLQNKSYLKIHNNINNNVGIITVSSDKFSAYDMASILAKDSICVRAGHHCAQPLMNILNVNSTMRISIGIYNNNNDLNLLFRSIEKCEKIFL